MNTTLLSVILISLTVASCSQADEPQQQSVPVLVDLDLDLVVEPAWLLAHPSETLVICDAREEQDYLAGHLPGAVHLPKGLTVDDSSSVPGRLSSVVAIRDALSKAGIGPEDNVLVYGLDDDYRPAARWFWVMETHGIERVSVLNGGIKAWVRVGGELETQASERDPSEFMVEFDDDCFADKLAVRRVMNSADVMIIDSRPLEQYTGEIGKEGQLRKGHIPGAFSLPVRELLTTTEDGWRLKDPRELREIYAPMANLRMITYCNSGNSASLQYLALRVIGADVCMYDGSWWEWSEDMEAPIETGAWRPGAR